MTKNILDSISGAAMKLPLRRTLVRSVILFGEPTPGRLQYNHSFSLPLHGGEVFQSTSITKMFIPSLEGQRQLLILKNLKGVGFVLLLSLFFCFHLLAQTWIWYPGDFEIVHSILN